MELFLEEKPFYRVKRGQTLSAVARTFGCSEGLIVKENALRQELWAGQVIALPAVRGNAYIVRGGESKTLLCGSCEAFERKNGTKHLFIGQRILL